MNQLAPRPVDRARVRLAAAWCRSNLPGKTFVAQRFARVDDDQFGQGAGETEFTDRWGQHRLRVDPEEYFQRWAWLLGRYHEWPLQLLMSKALRPGDTFVDIGANLGLVALRAAGLVGAGGVVRAFEPNPEVYPRLEWHVTRNALNHVKTSVLALGKQCGLATLRLNSVNTGTGSLADLPWTRDGGRDHVCTVERADAALADLPDRPTMIKIDVEGFECEVLLGMNRLIRRHRPLLVCEVNIGCLKAAGSGLRRLLLMTEQWGFKAFLFHAAWSLWSASRLKLEPLSMPPSSLFDLVFLHPQGPHWARLNGYVSVRSHAGSRGQVGRSPALRGPAAGVQHPPTRA